MSAAANVVVVQQAYAAFGEGNVAGILETLTEDVRWITPEVDGAPYRAVSSGKAEVAEWFAALGGSEEPLKFEPQSFVADGNRVAVQGVYGATVRATGKSYEIEWAQFFDLQDGKIAAFTEIYDSAPVSAAFRA